MAKVEVLTSKQTAPKIPSPVLQKGREGEIRGHHALHAQLQLLQGVQLARHGLAAPAGDGAASDLDAGQENSEAGGWASERR